MVGVFFKIYYVFKVCVFVLRFVLLVRVFVGCVLFCFICVLFFVGKIFSYTYVVEVFDFRERRLLCGDYGVF